MSTWWLPAHIHVVRHGVDVVVAVGLDVHVVVQHVDRSVAEHAVVPSRLVVSVTERLANKARTLIRAESLAFRQRGYIVGMFHRSFVQSEALAGLGRAFYTNFPICTSIMF